MKSSNVRRKRLMRDQKGKCLYCKRHMRIERGYPNTCTADHRIPASKGGKGGPNIVGACYRCNSLKGDMMPWVFRHKYPNPALMPEVWPLTGIENIDSRNARRVKRREEKRRRKALVASLPDHTRKRERAGFREKAMGYDDAATFSLSDVWPEGTA